jgi:hypothetical protein
MSNACNGKLCNDKLCKGNACYGMVFKGKAFKVNPCLGRHVRKGKAS